MTDSQVVTNEYAVLYITCSTSGFFVNESTDSTFDPANSIKYPVVYPTLMHLFIGVSPAFAEWYAKRVEEGDQTEKMRLEDLLCTLRPLPSSNVAASCWFGNSHSKDDTHDLFTYAETILGGDGAAVPLLGGAVASRLAHRVHGGQSDPRPHQCASLPGRKGERVRGRPPSVPPCASWMVCLQGAREL